MADWWEATGQAFLTATKANNNQGDLKKDGGRPGLRSSGARTGRRVKKEILKKMADWTGLEPATPGVTGRYSNQLNYQSAL